MVISITRLLASDRMVTMMGMLGTMAAAVVVVVGWDLHPL